MGDMISKQVLDRWQHPDSALLETILKQKWTSHNIPLTVDASTLGIEQVLIGDDRRCQLIKEAITSFVKPPNDTPMRLIDLGCLEGGLTFEMAREGIEALGVEGRHSNYEKCRLIQQYYSLNNLDFIHLDVKELNIEEHGIFHVILCCGLLYHLDNPASFLKQLAEMTDPFGMIYLDTHYAPHDEELDVCEFREYLSPSTTHAENSIEYTGRWYSEPPPEDDEIDRIEWASVSNHSSFWPSHKDLIRMMYDAGFTRIYELHGGYGVEGELDLKRKYCRVNLVGLKD